MAETTEAKRAQAVINMQEKIDQLQTEIDWWYELIHKYHKNNKRENLQKVVQDFINRAEKAEAELETANKQIELIEKQCQKNGKTAADRFMEIDRLKAELEKARTYTGFEGYPCPLCEYKDGVFIKNCEMHSQIAELKAELEKAEKWEVHLVGLLNCAESQLDRYRWIPVSEELPKKTKEDLRPKHFVLTEDGPAVQEWRHYDFGWEFNEDTGKPTHWMESITLPEQE